MWPKVAPGSSKSHHFSNKKPKPHFFIFKSLPLKVLTVDHEPVVGLVSVGTFVGFSKEVGLSLPFNVQRFTDDERRSLSGENFMPHKPP